MTFEDCFVWTVIAGQLTTVAAGAWWLIARLRRS